MGRPVLAFPAAPEMPAGVSGCARAWRGIVLGQLGAGVGMPRGGATAPCLGALWGSFFGADWGQVLGPWPFCPAAPKALSGPCSAPLASGRAGSCPHPIPRHPPSGAPGLLGSPERGCEPFPTAAFLVRKRLLQTCWDLHPQRGGCHLGWEALSCVVPRPRSPGPAPGARCELCPTPGPLSYTVLVQGPPPCPPAQPGRTNPQNSICPDVLRAGKPQTLDSWRLWLCRQVSQSSSFIHSLVHSFTHSLIHSSLSQRERTPRWI